MAAIDGENPVFALELGFTIPTGGVGGIGFGVGAHLFSIENIIGAEVEKTGASAGGGPRHHFRGGGVNREGLVSGSFSGIDIGHSGAVDEDVEFGGFEFGSEAFEIGNIRLGASPGEDGMAFGPLLGERGGEAASPTKDQDGFPC